MLRKLVPTMILAAGAAANFSQAAQIAAHTTDGFFNGSASSVSDAPEWGGPNVNKSFFLPAAGNSGNAYLYVEQVFGTLYLMYDYVGSPAGLSPNSFFDVFFEVGPADTDYGLHITQGGFTAFEKPIENFSNFNPDGSFDFNSAPWALIPNTDPDFLLANFHAQIGFGSSVNLSTPHWMAEFDVTIDSSRGGPQNGLYSPAPAFWSASTGGGLNGSGVAIDDPPISSAIFELNPDGSTTVSPLLVDGAPILEGSADAPEPATLWIFGPGALAILAFWKRRQARV